MYLLFFASLLLFSSAALADDKAIYEALNVQELGIPTPFPWSGQQKVVGRLSCTHLTNSKTNEERFTCQLDAD